jgi:hypothetical protein
MVPDVKGGDLDPSEADERRHSADGLLLEIARCPVVQLCLDHPEMIHPCAEIVRSQGASSVADFQMPEPWTGPIATAPILFISSNPSISKDEEYPTRSRDDWPNDRIIDFFMGGLGGGREEWTRRGIFVRRKDGSFATGKDWVRIWASAKQRAGEALGRPAVPGRDYAMTEVVRCKSIKERGVASAMRHCPDRYLDRTLAVAAAGLLICFGNHARDEIQRRYSLPAGRVIVGPVEIAGQPRYVVFLPHPNRPLPSHRPEKKSLLAALTSEELGAVRSFLTASSMD